MDSNVLLTSIENSIVRVAACFAVCIQGSIMLYTLWTDRVYRSLAFAPQYDAGTMWQGRRDG
jgi:hypothetical protein